MKDMDGLHRHIDILIHRHLTQANRVCVNDIALRPFPYSYDSFNTCSDQRRIITSDITIDNETSSLFPPPSIIHHSPIHFTPKPIIQSYSGPKPISHTFYRIITPEKIICLSFDSITTCSS